MKTAISLPDALYEEAERTARAVAEYIKRHRREGITERLNEVCEGTDASLDSLREVTGNDTW